MAKNDYCDSIDIAGSAIAIIIAIVEYHCNTIVRDTIV